MDRARWSGRAAAGTRDCAHCRAGASGSRSPARSILSDGPEAMTGATAADWRERIVAKLSNTQPRHAVADWLVPRLSAQDSSKYRSLFPATPIPAAVLVPLVERAEGLTVLLTP